MADLERLCSSWLAVTERTIPPDAVHAVQDAMCRAVHHVSLSRRAALYVSATVPLAVVDS